MTIVFTFHTLHITRVLRGVVKYNKSVKLKIEQCAINISDTKRMHQTVTVSL